MFVKSSESHYKILEVEKNCSNEDLKKSYRDLAKKHHPDKVQHMGDAYIKAAKEKFAKIQDAYEKIKKERDGLDFRGAFPGAVRRAPLACYWLFYMCPS